MFTAPRALGALGILLALIFIVGWLWNAAGDNALQKIERQDNEAGNASDNDRSHFDLCPDGMWDYGARKCRGAAPGRGN